MRFVEFEKRARRLYEEIPADFREGIDGLVVDRIAVPHPTLPDIYTLGECQTESYPSDYGGPGSTRSFVHLYHGSFERLARLDDEFDWDAELWETITHEIRHHLEWLASEDALEVQDYVEDQNFARREGEPFDPLFYRSGRDLGDGVYEVDGDFFVERPQEAQPAEGEQTLRWRGHELRFARPDAQADVHFVVLEGELPDAPPGELVLVLLRRAGLWRSVRALLGTQRPSVAESFVEATVA